MNINFSSKGYLLLILAFSILIIWPLFQPGLFFHHDDLQVMRIYEMRQCFTDFQIPCRWVPDMGYGNGFPLYNYYSALPYYTGALLSYPMGLINSTKALFFIPLVLGGIAMFLLSQKLFGKQAGFVSGVLYLFAPYRALDSYVRGAIAESFALAIIPLVFYFILEIIEKPTKKNLVLGSLSLAAFLLSHNIMTLFFMPLIVIWNLIFLYTNKWKNWKPALVSFLLGIGLAAFFLAPAFLEKDLVHSESLLQTGGSFRTHFVGISQLFIDRTWGFGGSVFGPGDTISFQIGWPLWWFVVAAIPLFIINFKKNKQLSLTAIFLLAVFAISVTMQHNKSAPIWEAVEFLQFAQFPWRFLSLSIFSGALIAGYVFSYLKFSFTGLLVWIVVILTIVLNWSFFQPREFYTWINDQNKLEDPLYEIQQKASILDYLPITAEEPLGRAPNNIEVVSGKAEGTNYIPRSNKFSVNINVSEDAYVQVPIFDFPNWTVYSNGNLITHDNKNTLGRIQLKLPPGQYEISGILKDTPIRTASNFATLFSGLVLLILYTSKRFFKLVN